MPDDAFPAVRPDPPVAPRLAEHVLAATRYHAIGGIGLQVVPGGFATPPFGDDHRIIGVDGTELVVRAGGQERRTPITTLRAAGEFADVEPGAPSDVYKPATPCDLDARLMVDADAARRLADGYALGDAALRRLRLEIADDQPSDLTLWPEHFDVAIRAGEVNYSASPGDTQILKPYLYVGPTGLDLAATGDRFWNQPFGAGHHLGRRPLGGGRSGVFPAGTPARRQLTDRPAGGRCCQGAA